MGDAEGMMNAREDIIPAMEIVPAISETEISNAETIIGNEAVIKSTDEIIISLCK